MLLNLNRSVIELPKWSEAGACALRGDAGGSGLLQAGEEMALGHLTSACNIYKPAIFYNQEDSARFLLQVHRQRKR